MTNASDSYFIGEMRVDPSLLLLTAPDGRKVRLTPKAIGLLGLLASQAGEVISRNDILDKIWLDSGAGDDSLNNVISSLRMAFGDSGKNQLYIETIPRLGYRLVAEVRATPVVERDRASENSAQARPQLLMIAAAIGVIVAVTVGVIFQLRSAPPVETMSASDMRPLTSFAGVERDPQFSPDDSQVAFVHKGDIFLVTTATGAEEQITNSVEQEFAPVWSPTGDRLAFLRMASNSCEIVAVTIASRSTRKMGDCAPESYPALTWHPSGRWIGYSERSSDTNAFNFVLFDIKTGVRTGLPVSSGDGTVSNYHSFQFSPNGDKVAFIQDQSGQEEIMVIVFDDGGENSAIAGESAPPYLGEVIATPMRAEQINGVAWRSNVSLIASLGERYRAALWRYSLGDIALQKIFAQSNNPIFPDVSSDGDRIVFADAQFDMDVWIATSTNEGDFQHRKLLDSTQLDVFPSFSPDGSRIAFVSSRSGHPEIWLANNEGVNLRQLTSFKADVTMPRWSATGDMIATSVSDAGQYDLWSVSPADGSELRLTNTPFNEVAMDWRGDGEALAFIGDSAGNSSIIELTIATGDIDSLAPGTGLHAQYRDGEGYVYFKKPGVGGLWRYAREKASTTLVVDDPSFRDPNAWALKDDGIYYTVRQENGDAVVRFQSFGNNAGTDYATIKAAAPFHHFSISVFEKDVDRRLLYSKTDVLEADITIANFVERGGQ